jgi:hypothetical protein
LSGVGRYNSKELNFIPRKKIFDLFVASSTFACRKCVQINDSSHPKNCLQMKQFVFYNTQTSSINKLAIDSDDVFIPHKHTQNLIHL